MRQRGRIFANFCLVAVSLLSVPSISRGMLVQVGDAIVDDKAVHFVIYYKSIPGVGNPEMRAHESFSFDEVADELRRAKNNDWEIDFLRSYMEFKGDIQLAGEPTSYDKRSSLKEPTFSVSNTAWTPTDAVPYATFASRGGSPFWAGLPASNAVWEPGTKVFVYFNDDGTYWIGNRARSLKIGGTSDGSGTWTQQGSRISLTNKNGGTYAMSLNGKRSLRVVEKSGHPAKDNQGRDPKPLILAK